MSVRLSIHPAAAQRFPEILVGWFRAGDLRQLVLPAGEVEGLFAAARQHLAQEGVSLERLATEPRIAAWRRAFESCGLRPSVHRSSPEQLARRALRGQDVSTPIALVNLYCAVSAKHLAPLGAYDLERLPEMSIELRPGQPGRDHFVPLGARPEDMPIADNVLLYASGDEVLCWAFNHRDSRMTCLTEGTDQAIFIGEAVEAVQYAALRGALEELASLLDAAGAQIESPTFRDRAGGS